MDRSYKKLYHYQLRHYLSLLFFLFTAYFSSYAQEFSMRNHNVKNGLPSNEVYNIFQDKEGYLWTGTDQGVGKFDGETWRTYRKKDGLKDHTIFGFHQDRMDRIWMRGLEGRVSYYQKDSIHTIFPNRKFGHILSLSMSPNDTLWFTTKNFYYKAFQNNEKKWQLDSLSDYYLFKTIGPDEIIWGRLRLSKDREVAYQIDDSTYQSTRLKQLYPSTREYLSLGYKPNYCFRYSKNEIRMDMGSRLIISCTKQGIKKIHLSKNHAITYNLISQNEFWVGSTNGCHQWLNDSMSIKYLEGSQVTSVLKDSEGGYWISTRDKGIFHIKNSSIHTFKFNNTSLKHPLTKLLNHNGELYFGSKYGSIRCISKPNSNLFDLSHDSLTLELSAMLSIQQKLYTNVTTIGSIILDPGSREKKIDSSVPEIFNYTYSASNHIIGVTKYSIVKMKASDLTLVKEIFLPKNTRPINIVTLKGKFYIASRKGLFVYDGDSSIASLASLHPLLSERIEDLQIDQYGKIWMVLRRDGVLVFDGGNITHIDTEKELLSDECTSITLHSNYAFIGSNRGVSRINLNDHKQIVNFNTHNGLSDIQIHDVQCIGDKIYSLSDYHIDYWHVDHVPQSSPSKVFIHEHLSSSDELKYPNANTRFDFSGIHFAKENDISFNYRLLGIDTNWTKTKDHSIEYRNLSPGNYTLQVKDASYKNAPFVSSSFQVKKAYWQQIWFRVFLLLVIGDLLFTGMQHRILEISKKEFEKRRFLLSELKALRAQMNPHFTFNGLNSIQHLIQHGSKEESLNFISKYARLIRLILDSSDQEFTSLEDEIELLEDYLFIEQSRFPNKLEYEIICDNELDISQKIPSMLLQPYVENAIWHGIMNKDGKGKITIQFDYSELDHLICTIKDDGVGRKVAQKLKDQQTHGHISKGMLINQDRLSKLNATTDQQYKITVCDLEDASGTRVDVEIW